MKPYEKLFLAFCAIVGALTMFVLASISANDGRDMVSSVSDPCVEHSDESDDSMVCEESLVDIAEEISLTDAESSECAEITEDSSDDIVCEISEESLEESSVDEGSEETVEESSEEYSDIHLMYCGDTVVVYVLDKDKNICDYIDVHLYNFDSEKPDFDDGKKFLADVITICHTLDYNGIPLQALLAQAYTEGGAGKMGVYKHSNNLFGIKAGANWGGMVYSRETGKTYDCYETAKKRKASDLFRAYYNIEESIKDYIDLIRTSDLYKGALNKTPKKYLQYLVNHGYGSEDMVSVWMSLIKLFGLKGVE